MAKNKERKVELPTLRDWLNPKDSWDNGYYKLTAEFTEYTRVENYKGEKLDKPEVERNLDMSLDLADCSRNVAFNFDCANKKKAKERLTKVRKLQKVLAKMESYLERYIDDDF